MVYKRPIKVGYFMRRDLNESKYMGIRTHVIYLLKN